MHYTQPYFCSLSEIILQVMDTDTLDTQLSVSTAQSSGLETHGECSATAGKCKQLAMVFELQVLSKFYLPWLRYSKLLFNTNKLK